MKQRVESAVERGDVNEDQVIDQEDVTAFKKWTPGFSRRNHPTVIEVLSHSLRSLSFWVLEGREERKR